jgi:hypothetical protein
MGTSSIDLSIGSPPIHYVLVVNWLSMRLLTMAMYRTANGDFSLGYA